MKKTLLLTVALLGAARVFAQAPAQTAVPQTAGTDRPKLQVSGSEDAGAFLLRRDLNRRCVVEETLIVADVQVGMQFQVQSGGGPRMVTVTQVAGDMVTVDGNHSLAGQTLNFEVEVTDVRAATAEELEHGHVHGPDGHHH